MKNWREIGTLGVLLAMTGCQTEHTVHIDVQPIEVKPITLNINIRVEKKLDDFFDFEKETAATTPAKNEGAKQ